jgi:hypothetical protein
MIFGRGLAVPDDEKEAALAALTEHLFPGHNSTFRPLQAQELKATMVIRVPLTEMSMKSRDGGPDDAEDNEPTRWSGVLPMNVVFGERQAEPHVAVPTPEHMKHWQP